MESNSTNINNNNNNNNSTNTNAPTQKLATSIRTKTQLEQIVPLPEGQQKARLRKMTSRDDLSIPNRSVSATLLAQEAPLTMSSRQRISPTPQQTQTQTQTQPQIPQQQIQTQPVPVISAIVQDDPTSIYGQFVVAPPPLMPNGQPQPQQQQQQLIYFNMNQNQQPSPVAVAQQPPAQQNQQRQPLQQRTPSLEYSQPAVFNNSPKVVRNNDNNNNNNNNNSQPNTLGRSNAVDPQHHQLLHQLASAIPQEKRSPSPQPRR